MKTEIHVVAEIPQTCDCAESVCVKLLDDAEFAHTTEVEKKRIWTFHSDDGENRLEYGISSEPTVEGYVLMPLNIKLSSDEVEKRTWGCPDCGEEIELSYDEAIAAGKPTCEHCATAAEEDDADEEHTPVVLELQPV